MRKRFVGEVLSDRMEKTLVVGINIVKEHPRYGKRFKRLKKYYVHDPQSRAKAGDRVEFEESKPISKMKRWVLVRVLD